MKVEAMTCGEEELEEIEKSFVMVAKRAAGLIDLISTHTTEELVKNL